MKNIILLFSLAFIFSINSNSNDNLKYTVSEKLNYGNQLISYEGVIGHDENNFYALAIETLPVIEKFNKNMELIDKKDIFYNKKFFSNITLQQIVYFHDSLYIFYIDGKLKSTTLYAQTIDKETLELNNDERVITEIKHLKGFTPDFHIEKSLNYNRLLVFSQINVLWSKSVHMKTIVLDRGLTIQWQEEEIARFSNVLPSEWQYVIDEKGNVHILTKIFEQRLLDHAFSDSPQKNGFVIFSYMNNGTEFYSNQLYLDNKFIRSIKIAVDKDGGYSCSGFFSENYKYGSLGVFFVKYNTRTNELRTPILNSFSMELLIKIFPEKKAAKQIELILIKANYFRQLGNGNYVLLGQQELDRDYDNKNDIILTCFSNYGEVIWNEVINKRQSGFKYTSYAFVNPANSNEFSLIFNDHPKNDFLPTYSRDKKSYGFPGPYFMHIINFNELGHAKHYRIKETKREKPTPIPNRFYDLRNGQIIMVANQYKKYQLVNMLLDM